MSSSIASHSTLAGSSTRSKKENACFSPPFPPSPLSGDGFDRAGLGTQPFLVRTVSTHYLTDYFRWRHPAARFGRFANDFPVSAAGLCIQRIAPDSETRLQKVGSLRSAFLASR